MQLFHKKYGKDFIATIAQGDITSLRDYFCTSLPSNSVVPQRRDQQSKTGE